MESTTEIEQIFPDMKETLMVHVPSPPAMGALPSPAPDRAGQMNERRTMAEGVGFEPTVTCATHAFQACRFGRSRTPPGAKKLPQPDGQT